jgi:hypothetical protein
VKTILTKRIKADIVMNDICVGLWPDVNINLGEAKW